MGGRKLPTIPIGLLLILIYNAPSVAAAALDAASLDTAALDATAAAADPLFPASAKH